MTHCSKYFYGNKISDYGLENKRLDYATLAKAFDAVLVNDITKLFYADIDGEYNEPEPCNIPDYSDEIDEISEQIDEIDAQIDDLEAENDGQHDDAIKQLENERERLEYNRDELENWTEPEVFQWYIVSDGGANIIQEFTDDPLYYLPCLDCYVWGVTHWGTSWDYVLTDVELDIPSDEN